jgi:hypothetical protein
MHTSFLTFQVSTLRINLLILSSALQNFIYAKAEEIGVRINPQTNSFMVSNLRMWLIKVRRGHGGTDSDIPKPLGSKRSVLHLDNS